MTNIPDRGGQRKRRLSHQRMNSARHSQGNHPLDSRVLFAARVYTRKRTSGTVPKGRYDSRDATTNGSPIVDWLLIRYLVLPLSNSPYRASLSRPPANNHHRHPIVARFYGKSASTMRPATDYRRDCEWSCERSRDTTC